MLSISLLDAGFGVAFSAPLLVYLIFFVPFWLLRTPFLPIFLGLLSDRSDLDSAIATFNKVLLGNFLGGVAHPVSLADPFFGIPRWYGVKVIVWMPIRQWKSHVRPSLSLFCSRSDFLCDEYFISWVILQQFGRLPEHLVFLSGFRRDSVRHGNMCTTLRPTRFFCHACQEWWGCCSFAEVLS